MDRHEDLTSAEQRYLERAGEAKQRGLTLEQYYRVSGLSLEWLHRIRRQLRRKGVVLPERAARAAEVTSGECPPPILPKSNASASGSMCRAAPHGQVTRTRKSPKQS